jgi:serine/threonine protein phosphatase PrpC
MYNQQVVNSIREIKNAQEAAEHLIQYAINTEQYDTHNDIS